MEIDLTKSDPLEMDIEMVGPVVSPSLSDSTNKRPNLDDKHSKTPKRAKLNSDTPISTPSQTPRAPSQSATPTATSQTPQPQPSATSSLVELKGNKLVVNQKPLDWTTKLSYTQDVGVFAATMTDSPQMKLDAWPEECWGIVAKLVHESDRSEQQIARTTKAALVKLIESAAEEDDSQDVVIGLPAGDRVPFGSLKTLIESLADRVNYGIDLADLPNGLPEGAEGVPAGLQVWRWEVKDEALLPKELRSKLDKRKQERVQIKADAVALFAALSPAEQSALLQGGKKATAPSTNGADPTASTSSPKPPPPVKPAAADKPSDMSTPKPKKAKVEKVKTAEELAAEAEKAREKEVKEAEKEQKRKEKEEKAKEKAEEKAQREGEKKAKEDKKRQKEQEKLEKEQKIKDELAKKEAAAKSQKSLMNSFFTKKAAPLTPAAAQASPTKAGKGDLSDFEHAFRPFEPGKRIIAPINRFTNGHSPLPEPQINSQPNLDITKAIADFLATVPVSRRLPRDNTRLRPRASVRDLVTELNESVAMGADNQRDEILKQLQSRTTVQIKHLQFREDVRPGYVGTWSKRSKLIGPRTPFERDNSTLNYEVDSEEEWEEEPDDPDAEAIGDEDEEEAGSEADSEVDSWLADDEEPLEYEEGYEGESPPPMDLDGDNEEEEAGFRAAKARLEQQKRKRSAEDGAKKKKLVGKLVPVQLGPCWEDKLGTVVQPLFASHRIQFINDWCAGLNPMTHVTKPIHNPAHKPAAPTASATAPLALDSAAVVGSVAVVGAGKEPHQLSARKVALQSKSLPDQHWPVFVRLVHRSLEVGPVLEAELYKQLHAVDSSVTKTLIKAAFSCGADKKKGRGSAWLCKPELVARWAPELAGAGGEGSPGVANGGAGEAVPMVIG